MNRRHHLAGVCAATAAIDFVRRGRRTSSPPQLGQTDPIASVHDRQNVHSKLQTHASPSGASAVWHFSQLVFIFSAMVGSFEFRVSSFELVAS
jgi:hypothetical protein